MVRSVATMIIALLPLVSAFMPPRLNSSTTGLPGPIFELDLFVNDPAKGWQPSGWPAYLQHSAANYTNVAGISFIQPADLMNQSYELPSEVAAAVTSLRKQGVAVQLLVGGEISKGWSELSTNPEQAAAKAIALMKKYDCGIEVDCEGGGASISGLVKFIQLCYAGKPSGVHLSMDVAGTPKGVQKGVIAGAIQWLDWVNSMVSAPAYDQGNSVHYSHADGVPYDKITVHAKKALSKVLSPLQPTTTAHFLRTGGVLRGYVGEQLQHDRLGLRHDRRGPTAVRRVLPQGPQHLGRRRRRVLGLQHDRCCRLLCSVRTAARGAQA